MYRPTFEKQKASENLACFAKQFFAAKRKVFKSSLSSLNMNHGRKITGGKYHGERKRRLHEILGAERQVILGPQKRKQRRMRSGARKTILLKADTANVRSGSKTQPAKIVNVRATPQNQFLARQNRLMKGAIIETSLGKARITNRPSREGQVNAILIEQE